MKKAMMILIPILALVLVFSFMSAGCKRKETASPVAPAVPTDTPVPANTSTFTISPTITTTNTLTVTHTFTRTITPTITLTPVLTFTFSATPTITDTATLTPSPTVTRTPTHTIPPTDTFTATVTRTPTATATVTHTATPCVAAYSNLYSFDTTTECWYVNDYADADMAHGCVSSWDNTTYQTGPGGMAVSATYNGTMQQKFQVEISLPTQHDIANATFSVYIRYSTQAIGTATSGAVQLFAQNGGSWDAASWIGNNATQMGQWTKYQMTMPDTVNTRAVNKLGIQIYAGVGAGPGFVYIDQVEIVLPPSPTPTHTLPSGITATDTPTFTTTPTSCTPVYQATYSFDTSSQCWAAASSLPAVMGWSGTTYDVGPGAMAVSVAFNPLATGEQDATVQIDFASPFVNITGAYISFRVRYSAGVLGTATYGAVQSFVQDDSWSFNDNYMWANAASLGSFNTYFLDLTAEGGNQAAIRRIGAKFIVGPGAGPGYIYIDEIHINVPAGTPTPTPTPMLVIDRFAASANGWVGSTLVGYTTPTAEGWSNTDGYFGTGCFQISFPALGADTSVGVMKVFGTPQNWSGATTLRVALRVNNTVLYYAGGISAFIKSDSDSDSQGVCLGGCWTNMDPASNWIYFSWPLTGVTDLSTVSQILLRFNTGGGGSSPVGDFRIDDVVLY